MRTIATWLLWTVAAAAAVLLAAMVVLPRLMGWVPLTVLTGSMEPAIPTGSQVYVRPVTSADDITTGDVVTFMPNPDDATLVTHRVVGIGIDAGGEKTFTVQGDANNAPDPQAVQLKQIRGVMMYHLPYVGALALAISADVRIVLITICGLSLLSYAGWQLAGMIRDQLRTRHHRHAASHPADTIEAAATEEERADA